MVRVKNDDASVAGRWGTPGSIIFAHLPIDGKAYGAVLERGVSMWRAAQETRMNTSVSRGIRTQEEDDQDAENLEHEPAVIRNAGIVLEQFSTRALDIIGYMHHIVVDPLHHFALLSHHVCELTEDLAQLGDRRLNRLDCTRALLQVGRLLVFELVQQKLLLLHAARFHHVQGKKSLVCRVSLVIGESLLAGRSAVMQLGYGLRPTCQRIERRLGSLLLHGRRDGALEKLLGAVFGRLHVLRPHLQNILEISGGICERGLQHRDDITAMLVRATRSRTTSHRIWLQLGQLAIQTSDVVLDNVSKLRNLHRSVIKEGLSTRELGKPIQLGRGLAQIMRYSLSSSREFCMCRCRASLRRSRRCWGAAGIFC